MKNAVSVIILTYNEEKHLKRCIQSLQPYVHEIFVVDSFSTDQTTAIAESLGAKVYQNSFINHATQFNWGLKNCPIKTDWVWRVDADEYITNNLGSNIQQAIEQVDDDTTGIYIKRPICFMGKILRHGTWYPRWYLKVFRYGIGECENRWMDEHIVLSKGKTIQVEGDQIDDNLNNLTWWTQKHNAYASREAIDVLFKEYSLNEASDVQPKLLGNDDERLRWLKAKYNKIPLFVRPFFNFFYRYILRGGFRDGKQGFIWHILQGFWYRMLVDAKVWELKKQFNFQSEKIKNYLIESYKT
jgi:glycosyltransferase involved in cell wall biosynthesis